LLQEQKLPHWKGRSASRFRATARLTNLVSRSDRQPGAAHLARQLLSEKERSVRSTLSAALQRYARDTLVHQLAALKDRNVEDGAVVVLDNASGDVLAWIGSSGALSDAREVDGVTALRQAGSTLKPFLYELALEKN
jgi:penicillin-binding protein 1C